MVNAHSSRHSRATANRTLAASILAALLVLPLAAFVPAALADPSTVTVLSDGSSSASLYFAECGSDAGGISVALPFNAHVERMNFSLTTTGNATNQSGSVAVFVGGHDEPVANVSVETSVNGSVEGTAFNGYLSHQNATSGDVLVPLAFVGCSHESEWWVEFGDLELVFRLPTNVTFAVTSPAAAVTYTGASNFTVSGTVVPSDCTVSVNGHEADVDGALPVASWSALIGLELGENGVRVVACANYGEGAVIERTIVRSEGGVNLTIESPAPHTITNDTNITVRGTTDAHATVQVNGENVSVNATTGVFEVVVQLNGTDGETENVITVVARDGQGGEQWVNITVIVDTRAPSITLHLGADLAAAIEAGQNISWNEVTIAGTTDSQGAHVEVNGHAASVEGFAFSAVVALDEGENTVVIVATDRAGNRAEVSLTIWVDTVAPPITLDLDTDVAAAIEAGLALHQTTLNVTGSTDSADTVVVVNGHETNRDGANFSFVVELADGQNRIVIVAEDHAGNRNELVLTVLVDLSNPGLAVTLDATAREAIAHERPTRNASVAARVESNASTVRFTLNGQLMSEWNGSMNLSITLSEGNNTLLFEAIEGELSSSEEIHLRLDTVAPALSATLNGTTEANGTYTSPSRLLTVVGATDGGASVSLCTSSTEANATAWCHGVDVADNGSFHGLVELDAHHANNVTVRATDPAGNIAQLSFTVVYEAPGFTNDTVVSVHIGGTHEGTIVAGSELVLEVGSEVAIPEGANVSWYIDDVYVGSGQRLADIVLEEGNHTIVVVVTTDTAQASASRDVVVEAEAPSFTDDTVVSVHIGGAHEDKFVAGSELVLEVGSEVAIPEGANVSWYVDGAYIGSGRRLADITLDEGNHTVEVVVTTDTAQASASRDVYVEPEARMAPAGGSGLFMLAAVLGLVAVGAAVSATERGRYMVFGALLGSVFTRLRKPAPLDHFVRGRLYQLISDEPGIHYAELRRRANLSNGVAAHHLRVLTDAGILRTVQDGTRMRFFPTDQPMDRETYGLSDADRAVLDTVTQSPGITEGELSERVGKSLSTVNRSVDRMVALGYVTTTRQGRAVSVFPRAGREDAHAAGAVQLPDDGA